MNTGKKLVFCMKTLHHKTKKVFLLLQETSKFKPSALSNSVMREQNCLSTSSDVKMRKLCSIICLV